MYLSYDDYVEMGGALEETDFDDLAFEAGSTIDWYTFGRLRNMDYADVSNDVKRCMYRLIGLIQDARAASALSADTGGDGGGASAAVASQSNDGVSVSYNVMGAKDALDNSKEQVEMAVKRYLSYVTDSLGRKVLYRGLYPGE